MTRYIEKKNKDKKSKTNKEYFIANRKRIYEYKRLYRLKNVKKARKWQQKYTFKNKEKIKLYHKSYRQMEYVKLIKRLRESIRRIVKNGHIKQASTMKLIGCSLKHLRNHLQQTAIINGYYEFNIMNYDGKKYHIDHIKPICSFDLSKKEEQFKCFNWANLQILESGANLSKNRFYRKVA